MIVQRDFPERVTNPRPLYCVLSRNSLGFSHRGTGRNGKPGIVQRFVNFLNCSSARAILFLCIQKGRAELIPCTPGVCSTRLQAPVKCGIQLNNSSMTARWSVGQGRARGRARDQLNTRAGTRRRSTRYLADTRSRALVARSMTHWISERKGPSRGNRFAFRIVHADGWNAKRRIGGVRNNHSVEMINQSNEKIILISGLFREPVQSFRANDSDGIEARDYYCCLLHSGWYWCHHALMEQAVTIKILVV